MSDVVDLNKIIDDKFKRGTRKRRWVVYSILWIFLIIVALIYNPVLSLLHKSHEKFLLTVVLSHPVLIFVGVLFLLILFLGITNFLFFLTGFLILPFRPVFWLTSNSIKGVVLFLFSFVTGAFSYVLTYRYKAIMITLFIGLSIIILKSMLPFLLIVSMFILLIILFVHYTAIFLILPKPLDFNKKLPGLFFQILNWFKSKSLEEYNALKIMAIDDEKYSEKRCDCFGQLWFLNRVYKKIINYLSSPRSSLIVVIYFTFITLLTLLFTILIFSLEFYALFKINPNGFTYVKPVSYIDFILFSFTSITTVSFENVTAQSHFVWGIVALEVFCGIILGLFLFFLFTTLTMESYKGHLWVIAGKLKQDETIIKQLIREEFSKDYKDLHERSTRQLSKDVLKSFKNEKWRKLIAGFYALDESEFGG